MNRVKNTKLILWLITGFGLAIALNRYIFGMGATTNLSDKTPWGFWVGFDVMAGVALAAGGFVTTAIFYMMKRDDFHPLVKPAVLTAFLGYLSVIFGLLVDLGLPWNIWHLMIYWNPHSPLFEVGWCVMLYTTVLLLEFSPTPLEEFSRYAKIRNVLMKLRFPLVLLGIMLSTLHQSSLGTLFLIMPYRVSALWYSHILPIEFFISAVALGLMMVAFESLASHWLYRRKPETDIVGKLCRIAMWVLALYFVVKIENIVATGKFGLIFDGSWLSYLFIVELLISTVIPAVMFAVPKWTRKPKVQWIGASMVVVGMVLNRLDVGGLAMNRGAASYTPSWMEIAISIAIVSAAVLVFLFMTEHFHIWDIRPQDPESLPHTAPEFDHASQTWLGAPSIASLAKHSLAFVLSFAVGMALISGTRLHAQGIDNIKVSPAFAVDNAADTLCIDGNRGDNFVEFDHQAHIKLIGKDSCFVCHHLNLPGAKLNQCWQCHTSMYKEVEFFNHSWHTSSKGANLKCDACHTLGVTRSAQSAKQCTACHPAFKFSYVGERSAADYLIPSYVGAMHKLCVSCHAVEAKKSVKYKNLALCSTCHKVGIPPNLQASMKWKINAPHYDNVEVPGVEMKEIEREFK